MKLTRNGATEDLKYNTKRELLADLDKIESIMPFPVIPVNQETGEPVPDAAITRWIDRDTISVGNDGKYRMKKPADEFLTGINDTVTKTRVRTIKRVSR